MKHLATTLLLAVLIATPVMGGRLDEETGSSTQSSSGSTGNGTVLPPNDVAFVCLTDDVIFGFCEPGERPGRKLGKNFFLYITPLNGSVTYQVFIDDEAQELRSTRSETATTDEPVIDYVESKALRRAHLLVKVTHNEETYEWDYGRVRFRTPSDLDKDADDEDESFIEKEVRKFTDSQFLWYRIWWGLGGIFGIAGGAIAGIAFSREQKERERAVLVGA